MPYIITASEPFDATVHVHRPAFSRTAVATLEEMHQKAFGAIDRASKMDRDMNSDEQRADRGFRLAVRFDLDNGGSIGPLPDGTVIEVRPVDRFTLGWEAGLIAADHPQLWKDANLVKRFNAS